MIPFFVSYVNMKFANHTSKTVFDACSNYQTAYHEPMHIPGHLAIALIQHRLPTLSTDRNSLKPLLLASLFPDIVDKLLGYGFHIMPNGRHYAHNIFSLLGSTAFVTVIWGKRTGYAWFAGYLGHLIVDRDSLVPWFFPLQTYNFKKGRFSFNRDQFLKELPFLLLTLVIYRLAP